MTPVNKLRFCFHTLAGGYFGAILPNIVTQEQEWSGGIWLWTILSGNERIVVSLVA